MAGQRMISTGFFKSSIAVRLGERYSERSPYALSVFLALILEADDHGRGRYAPVAIRAAAFACDPAAMASVSLDDIDAWCREIEEDGSITLYGDNGRGQPAYYAFPKWDDYQRLQYRKKSHIPEPNTTAVFLIPEAIRRAEPPPEPQDKIPRKILTVVSDVYQRHYLRECGVKPSWGQAEFALIKRAIKRVADDIALEQKAQLIADAIDLAWETDDPFITSARSTFKGIMADGVLSKLIYSIGKERKRNGG